MNLPRIIAHFRETGDFRPSPQSPIQRRSGFRIDMFYT